MGGEVKGEQEKDHMNNGREKFEKNRRLYSPEKLLFSAAIKLGNPQGQTSAKKWNGPIPPF